MTDPSPTFPEPTFQRHVFDLAQQVAIALGETENPISRKRGTNLEAARYLIDLLAMLQDKTDGNLDEEEARYLQGVIANLKMAYVRKTS